MEKAEVIVYSENYMLGEISSDLYTEVIKLNPAHIHHQSCQVLQFIQNHRDKINKGKKRLEIPPPTGGLSPGMKK